MYQGGDMDATADLAVSQHRTVYTIEYAHGLTLC